MLSQNHAKFKFLRDEDGTGELHVRVHSQGFIGAGSAWFLPNQLVEFASKLGQIRSRKEPFPELTSGYLDQPHITIRVYPVGKTYHIGVHIRLATHIQEPERIQNQHVLIVELDTHQWYLDDFAIELIKLSKGEVDQAILVSQLSDSDSVWTEE